MRFRLRVADVGVCLFKKIHGFRIDCSVSDIDYSEKDRVDLIVGLSDILCLRSDFCGCFGSVS
jgi:hypothetical protein